MLIKSSLSKLFALVLVVVISLVGCSNGTGLTGNYSQDTFVVIESLTSAIELPADTEMKEKQEIQKLARLQINDYISRYRVNGDYGSLKSYTTMQTALNSLAGFYTTYGNRPLPEKLKNRLLQEFKQVKAALKRGF
jgi:photosystem II Psb27 protein